MSREEFLNELGQRFSIKENVLITFAIYLNPDHLEYYKKYHGKEHEWCLQYLDDHRDKVSLENVPQDSQSVVKEMLKTIDEWK